MRIRGQRSAAGVALVLCVPLGHLAWRASANDEVLLSRGRPTVASSTLGPAWAAAAATDADAASRWASAPGPGTQWLRIDLGAVRRRRPGPAALGEGVREDVPGADLDRRRELDRHVRDPDRQRRHRRPEAARRLAAGTCGCWPPSGAADRRLLAVRRAGVRAGRRRRRWHGVGVAGDRPRSPPGWRTPRKKETALELVSSAENSTLNWRQRVRLHRGHRTTAVATPAGSSASAPARRTCSPWSRSTPGASRATCWPAYLPALRTVDGSDSHAGLDPGFPAAWKAAAADPVFQKVQEDERDRMYFNPAVRLAKRTGCAALGPVRLLRRGGHARRLRAARHPGGGDAHGGAAGPGRRRDRLPERVPRRPGRRDAHRGGAQRHHPGRHRPARLPAARATSTWPAR